MKLLLPVLMRVLLFVLCAMKFDQNLNLKYNRFYSL